MLEIEIKKDKLEILADLVKEVESVSFDFSKIDFNFNEFKLEIFNVIDACIAQDKEVVIKNLPMCFGLGYKRYFQFSSESEQINKCSNCAYVNECLGITRDFLEKFGDSSIQAVGSNYVLSNLEKCMLKILRLENNIPSSRVVELGRNIKLCASCDDGIAVINTGEDLLKRGLVKREFKQGQYFWCLT